jgi:hypothetical protein
MQQIRSGNDQLSCSTASPRHHGRPERKLRPEVPSPVQKMLHMPKSPRHHNRPERTAQQNRTVPSREHSQRSYLTVQWPAPPIPTPARGARTRRGKTLASRSRQTNLDLHLL